MLSSYNIVRAIKSRRLRWTGHVARMEEGRSAFKILSGKPTGKRPLGRPMRRWEGNARMDLKTIYINTRNWVDSAQDRVYFRTLVNVALNLRFPQAKELVTCHDHMSHKEQVNLYTVLLNMSYVYSYINVLGLGMFPEWRKIGVLSKF